MAGTGGGGTGDGERGKREEGRRCKGMERKSFVLLKSVALNLDGFDPPVTNFNP